MDRIRLLSLLRDRCSLKVLLSLCFFQRYKLFNMNSTLLELNLQNLEAIHTLLLESYEKAKKTLFHMDFDSNVLPKPENRELLNKMLDSISKPLLEISHIDSFLQHCVLCKTFTTPEQLERILACQHLCQDLKKLSRKVLDWTWKLKAHLNEVGCPILNDDESDPFLPNKKNTIVSPEMLQTYQKLRNIFGDIHKDLLFVDPENLINTAGAQLDVVNGKQMFIETEHEMNVLIDYGLFEYRKNGESVVERYYKAHHALYSGLKLTALRSLKEARFSLLPIIGPVQEQGLIVSDPLTDEFLVLIDRGLHRLIQSHQDKNYALLTHYLLFPGFIMTTGASVPIDLDSLVGQKMGSLFQPLVRHSHQEILLDTSSQAQCIADLYKMAIHEDLVKTVSSRHLPMNFY